jgi:uncharacterized protein YbaA (DUF1428 family)
MYIQGFLVPVPADKKEEYREIASKFAEIMKDFGLIEDVEAWEESVPDGEHTDFRKAVKLEDGEKVVFSWLVWPDKATCEASHAKMMEDPRFKEFGDQMPFDGKRMIYGGFEPLVVFGRK